MTRRWILFLFVTVSAVAFGALKVEVKRIPAGRTNLVVHCPLTAEQAVEARGKALVAASGEAVPFAIADEDGSAVLSILLPGVTREGDSHVLSFRDGVAEEVVSDLNVQVEGGKVAVHNQYYSLTHAKGLPQEIVFGNGAKPERSIQWLDRIYNRELGGQFFLSPSSMKLLSSNPLRAVVEVAGGYELQDGTVAPGNPRMTYRFIYTAFSPVVEVEGVIAQEGEIVWPEVDFCQVSTGKKLVFNHWLVGTPKGVSPRKLSESTMEGNAQAVVQADGWLVMENDLGAVGVSGQAVAHDALKEFMYYLRPLALRELKGKSASGATRLYLGPCVQNPEWYASYLARTLQPLVHVYESDAVAGVSAEASGVQELDFGDLVLSLMDVAHGYAVAGIRAKAGGPQFCTASDPRPLWRLEFRRGIDATAGVQVSALDVTMENTSLEREGDTVTLRWKEVPVDETGTAEVTVRAKVTGTRIDWTMEVENHSTASGLWESEFPILSEVFPAGQGDLLTPSVNLGGVLRRNNARSYFLSPYPGSGAPVQLLAFLRDGYGLYFAAHDGEAWVKRPCVTAEQDAFFKLPAENCGVPGSGQTAAFSYATEVFQGDWWRAAKLYRTWAAENASWLRNGLIRDNPEYPKDIQEICYWFQTSADADQMREKLSKYVQTCPVKHGMHWYRWHEIAFDTHYPEYNPARPGVPEVTAEAVARGQVVMPYINGHIWDQDIPSFAAEGLAGACLDPKGEPYLEIYPSKARQAPMCPATEVWQKKILGVCKWLVDDIHVNAIYLDQIGAHRPDFCYNTAHGHPLGGGHYWVSGYREMLTAINDYAKAEGKPLFLTTENTADPYMDNVHGFLTWTERVEDTVPLLPAIYSGYTYYFACPASPQDTLLSFRMSQGHDFLLGVQFGWNSDFLQGEKYAEYWSYEMELAKLRAATLDFLSRGELMGEIHPKNRLPEVTDTWHWHVNRGTEPREVTLPAVEGTWWQDGKGDLCVYLVNYSDQVQVFEYDLPKRGADKVLLTRVTVDRRTPLAVVADGSGWRAYLRPREVVAVEIQPEAFASGTGPHPEAFASGTEPYPAQECAGTELVVNPQVPLVAGEVPQAIFRWVGGEIPEGLAVEVAGREFRFDHETRSAVVELPRGADQELFEAKVTASGMDGAMIIPLQLMKLPALETGVRLPERVFAGMPFACEVTVTNHSATARDAEVLLQLPKGWTRMDGEGLLRFAEVPSQEKRAMTVTCLADETATSDTAEVIALIVQGRTSATTTVLPPRASYRARKAAGITVDGDLSDWGGADAVRLGETTPVAVKYAKHPYGGDADLSCEVRFAWDEEFLYVGAKVRDDCHVNPVRSSEVWKGDAIQFALREGGPADRASAPAVLQEFAVGVDAVGAFVQTWNNQGQFSALVRAASAQADDTLAMEFAVPWKLLGLAMPQANASYGISFVVSDNDSPDILIEKLSSMDGYLEWTPGIFYGKDPSRYAILTLE